MSLDTQIVSNGLYPLIWKEGGADEDTAVIESTRPNRRYDRAKFSVLICSFEHRLMIIE